MNYRIVLLPLALTFLFLGCGRGTQEILIWTDRVELVTHAELFNVEEYGFYAVVEYVPSPSEALEQRAERPDVIVADYLGSPELLESFLVLDRRFRRFDPDTADVYPGLLTHGQLRGRQRIYPVSFDLPGLLALEETVEELPDFMLELAELQERGGAYNETESGRLTRLGYSPRWSPEFLYTMFRLTGVRFVPGEDGTPQWDTGQLERALRRTGEWIAQTNLGLDAEIMFDEQYLYDPMPQLVRRGRILFSYAPASEFFTISETRRRDFDIRWLAQDGQIPVLESMVFAGVLRDSRHKGAALDFVDWIASAETHRRILENAQRRRLGSFGVLGGFSAHREINEWFLPELYPSLLGKVPPAQALSFPEALPDSWDLLKQEVVKPWLARAVDQGPGLRPLESLVESWMLQKGD